MWNPLPGRRRVPPDVEPHLNLARGERPLAVATLDDGSTAVATGLRLLVAAAAGPRWGVAWHEVDAAAWEPQTRALHVHLVAGSSATLVLDGEHATLLPEVVRERVQSSVVLSQRVEALGRRGGARVVVRRAGRELVVQVVPDPGADLADPRVAAEVERTRRQVVRAAGLDGPSPSTPL
jgi:hypothetical protein